jgi:hypothetical protein
MLLMALLSAAIFFIFIYTPKRTVIYKLRQELGNVKDSLARIEAIVGERKYLGEGILKLRKEAGSLQSKFIKTEDVEELLKILSDDARRLGIEVVSMQPSEFKIWYDKKGRNLEVDNLECNKISVDMRINGAYKPLTDYMQGLENKDFPLLIIRKFDVQKSQGAARLGVNMIIDGFALYPKRAKKE